MFAWFWEWLFRLIRRLRKDAGCGTASVSITPSSGPAGSVATIRISGLRGGDAIGVTIGPGTHTVPGADANGNASITEIINGEPNEVVSISVVTGSGICQETTVVTFTLTN